MGEIDDIPIDQLLSAFHEASAVDAVEIMEDREQARRENRGTWMRHRPESVELGVMEQPMHSAEGTASAEATPVPMPDESAASANPMRISMSADPKASTS